MTPLDFHALEDEDTYIVLSRAKGTDEVVVHIHGESEDIQVLLEAAFRALDDTLEEVVHH